MRWAPLVLLAACGGDATPPCAGRVCGGQIRDDDGRAMILRGMNFSGENKYTPYLADHTTRDDLVQLRGWGFDAIRWVMPWAAVEPTEGAYDDAYLAEVRDRLDWAEDLGISVILDMHQDVYGEGFTGFDGAPRWTCDEAHYAAFTPTDPWALNYLDDEVVACFDQLWTDPDLGAKFAAAWRHVAATLGDHPAVLGFDVINEPHWGSYPVVDFEADRLQPFYDRVIAAVRAEAPAWIAFVEPASSRNFGFPTSLHLFDAPDVVYAPHAYDSTAEQGNGFDPAQREAFIDNIADLRDEATRLDAALWIGEYGGLAADPSIGDYMDAAYDGAAAVSASSMYWDYSPGGYGPIDADGNEVPALLDAIVRPYPSRIAGDPIAWSYDGALTVTWRADAGTTELVYPARLAPDGVDVDCGGCDVTVDGDVIALSGLSGEVTATVTPR